MRQWAYHKAGAAHRNGTSATVEGGREWITWALAIAGLLLIGVSIVSWHHWYETRVMTRAEIHEVVKRLDEGCRPIMRARFRDRIVEGGRPLTRSEVHALADGIRDCHRINEQMLGLVQD